MTAALFQPIALDGLTFPNRIAVAPMCQYSAEDGSASDWHLYHWMNLAMSGAGMVTVEMTDVERRGRITHGCLGLYSDDNEAAARRTLDAARRVAAPETKFGIQLAHAGRKASNRKPWEGGGPLQPGEDPWQTVSASAIAYDTGWNVPHALEEDEILQLIERFTQAAKRAERAGFDFLELHAAHGYLIFQFLSPLSNQRTDRWGGSLENRMRFLIEIAKSVRKAVPNLMLGARLSVKDWVDGGFEVEEAIEVAKALKALDVAYICCSSGGNSPLQKLPTGAGYQVHLAEAVRKGAGIPTRAVGLIDDPSQAEAIVADGRADIVALARAFLADPRWGWRAAATFSEKIHPAPQLARSVTTMQHWTKG
ncbi:NADH:flavin oxidoreductase/NADH oxidase [Mesorhizobium sp. M1148]|uniref:NADH:flavin oxidoreductase/NADH oxidase n=1 Tax=unclassified Mesorhizobium TaxID=325217 RepID=UPI0003CF9C92|nr:MULTISPECIES: NADH:flavin oxidoreductase/NADH oxidase [unclassified Mesorhizobium]ESX23126.1 oxidoreductase [Mesorhizobium sp. LSJC264A00]ESY49136.1 oxidoreductase [Mesorhizobium sp. LNJC380A00]ESY57352.1 oxidoreductase [Mesorhizobium sp. LNJC374B00]ESY60050.1 oxidoreductase [Mesorhizobium sp. LNJC372A00]ESZ42765.1 oxidoreductase [Mesorhizobium sp. L2C066B000]